MQCYKKSYFLILTFILVFIFRNKLVQNFLKFYFIFITSLRFFNSFVSVENQKTWYGITWCKLFFLTEYTLFIMPNIQLPGAESKQNTDCNFYLKYFYQRNVFKFFLHFKLKNIYLLQCVRVFWY